MKPSLPSRITSGILSWTGMLILIFLFGLSLISTSYISSGSAETTTMLKDNPALILIILAAFLIGLFLLRRSKVIQTFGHQINTDAHLYHILQAVLLSLTAGLALYWIFSVQAEPGADQKTVLKIAGELLDGNTEAFQANGYVTIFPHQTGFVLAAALLAKFFGTGYLPFQIINVGGVLLADWELAETAGLFENRNTVRLAVLLICLLFYPLCMYASFVYGTVWSFALALAAMRQLLLFFRRQTFQHLLGMAGLLFLSVFLKENSLIFLIAMAITALAASLQKRQKKPLLAALACIVVFGCEQFTVRTVQTSLSGRSYTAGASAWCYIAMGTTADNTRAPGWYLKSFGPDLYISSGSAQAEAVVAKQTVQNNLNAFASNPAAAMTFFLEKNASQWNNPTFQGYWIVTTHTHNTATWLLSTNAMTASYAWLNILQSLILAGSILYLLLSDSSHDAGELLYLTALIGGFLFHSFWEAKCQYTLPYFLLLLPMAVIGYARLLQQPRALLQKHTKKAAVVTAVALCTAALWLPYSSNLQLTSDQPAQALAKETQTRDKKQ